MLIKDIMMTEVITVTPDDSLGVVGKILKEKRVSGVPVCDSEMHVVGIITLTDMLRILDQIFHWKEMEKKVPDLKLSNMFEKEKLNAKVKDVIINSAIASATSS